MNAAGIIIFTIDLLKTLYTGLANVAEEEEKAVYLGEHEITKDSQHAGHWLTYVGITMMVVGGAVLVLGRKKSPTF